MSASTSNRTVRGVLSWVVPSIAIAEVGLFVTRLVVPREILLESNDVVGNYLQTLGSVYAVLLAFVVFMVWSQYNETRNQVEREANELVDLFRTVNGLPEPTRGQVHRLIRDYVGEVLGGEWGGMSTGGDGFEAGDRILDRVAAALHGCEAASDCHAALFSESLQRFNGLSDARTNRLTSSRSKIPLGLRFLLYTGSMAVVGSMYLFAVDLAVVHALITGALAAALAHVLYVIHDLDDCFAGAWQVPRSAFERVQRYIVESAAPP